MRDRPAAPSGGPSDGPSSGHYESPCDYEGPLRSQSPSGDKGTAEFNRRMAAQWGYASVAELKRRVRDSTSRIYNSTRATLYQNTNAL